MNDVVQVADQISLLRATSLYFMILSIINYKIYIAFVEDL